MSDEGIPATDRTVQDAILLACIVAHMLNGPAEEPINKPLSPEIDLYRPFLDEQMQEWLLPEEWRSRLERALTVWHRHWRGRRIG